MSSTEMKSEAPVAMSIGSNMPIPKLGDTVLFVRGAKTSAAIVTEVFNPSCVNLAVFTSSGGVVVETSVSKLSPVYTAQEAGDIHRYGWTFRS